MVLKSSANASDADRTAKIASVVAQPQQGKLTASPQAEGNIRPLALRRTFASYRISLVTRKGSDIVKNQVSPHDIFCFRISEAAEKN